MAGCPTCREWQQDLQAAQAINVGLQRQLSEARRETAREILDSHQRWCDDRYNEWERDERERFGLEEE